VLTLSANVLAIIGPCSRTGGCAHIARQGGVAPTQIHRLWVLGASSGGLHADAASGAFASPKAKPVANHTFRIFSPGFAGAQCNCLTQVSMSSSAALSPEVPSKYAPPMLPESVTKIQADTALPSIRAETGGNDCAWVTLINGTQTLKASAEGSAQTAPARFLPTENQGESSI